MVCVCCKLMSLNNCTHSLSVERTGNEELFRIATGGITVVANIFVEKLAALIVPHVDDDASVVSENDLRILMFETAERRTLFGRRIRIERIDFTI